MRAIFLFLLLAGLGLAGFAITKAQDRFAQYQAALDSTKSAIIDVEDVFVVKRSLRYGDVLRETDVQAVLWPKASLPSGVFPSKEAIFPPGEDGGRTVLRAMEKGEPLLQAKVTDPGADAGVAATLTPGMRAFALRVDVMSGVSGFLRPGDRVDVYWTGNDGEEVGGITRLIHASLPLIAIDQVTDAQRNSPTIARTVTVEAPPRVVAKLAQAQATGKLTLALVGVRDDTLSEEVEATLEEIVGPEEIREQERICYQTVRKGAEAQRIRVECPEQG
ncbi:Flp pilus assembly protein CpaB [Jannaschia aquimarina]|uniref:SAF domain protein n=1 Tax=Jannaschia aquimarina TaxID=935700 RepID=A0A0D1EI16_9RHOB|nr:Flp pilus assembly protein CpaB [Jannaschia aquimarina]KIT16536.1 SAF domain protein [Jannaschia aquimarina]SNT06246.1 pilus assembly protein CpaB [Jannaschia aquimarina]